MLVKFVFEKAFLTIMGGGRQEKLQRIQLGSYDGKRRETTGIWSRVAVMEIDLDGLELFRGLY